MVKVLLVDDDMTICRVARFILEDEGYQVDVANDGNEGLEKALSETPDVIITDLMMPKMDGLMMLTKIRRAQIEAPALLSTSLPEESLSYVPPKPYQGFLEKPYEAKMLIDAVKGLMKSAD